MNERRMLILKDVSSNEKLSVHDLAAKYQVSQVTIRSDLKALENQGLVRRIHGGAVNLTDERIANRLQYHYEIKLRIAERAAQLVEPGETILIESGSTNALLARKLGETKDVTIVTNSYFIASFVRDLPRVKTILLGGDYQPDAEICVGPLTCKSLDAFYVDKLFVGSDGFSEEGFTNMDLLRAEVASAMAKRANQTIILTDSSKFSTRGVSKQLSFSELSLVITDDGIPDFARQLLKKNKVELITVAS